MIMSIPSTRVVLERRRIDQRRVRSHRPQIGIDAQRLADAQQPFFGTLLRRRVVELRQSDRAHQRRVGFERQVDGFLRKRDPVLWMAMPPSKPSLQHELVTELAAPLCCRTLTASRVTSVPIPSPGRIRYVKLHGECLGDLGAGGGFAGSPVPLSCEQRHNLFIPQALLVDRPAR